MKPQKRENMKPHEGKHETLSVCSIARLWSQHSRSCPVSPRGGVQQHQGLLEYEVPNARLPTCNFDDQ